MGCCLSKSRALIKVIAAETEPPSDYELQPLLQPQDDLVPWAYSGLFPFPSFLHRLKQNLPRRILCSLTRDLLLSAEDPEQGRACFYDVGEEAALLSEAPLKEPVQAKPHSEEAPEDDGETCATLLKPLRSCLKTAKDSRVGQCLTQTATSASLLYQRFKMSPPGILLMDRWLPIQDTGLDLLVAFGKEGWPLCSEDGPRPKTASRVL